MEAATEAMDFSTNPSLHDYDNNDNNETETEQVESRVLVRSEQGEG